MSSQKLFLHGSTRLQESLYRRTLTFLEKTRIHQSFSKNKKCKIYLLVWRRDSAKKEVIEPKSSRRELAKLFGIPPRSKFKKQCRRLLPTAAATTTTTVTPTVSGRDGFAAVKKGGSCEQFRVLLTADWNRHVLPWVEPNWILLVLIGRPLCPRRIVSWDDNRFGRTLNWKRDLLKTRNLLAKAACLSWINWTKIKIT